MKFKVGDTVEWERGDGAQWTIDSIGSDGNSVKCTCIAVGKSDRYIGQKASGHLVSDAEGDALKVNKTSMSSKVGSMMKRILDADTRKLVKAGLINGDLELTSDGEKALMAIVFTTNKTALLQEADDILAEEEKTK